MRSICTVYLCICMHVTVRGRCILSPTRVVLAAKRGREGGGLPKLTAVGVG